MFLVGGSIIGHGLPFLHHLSEHLVANVQSLPAIGGVLKVIAPMLVDAIVGLLVGAICVALFELTHTLLQKK
jgi:uncharacterized protein